MSSSGQSNAAGGGAAPGAAAGTAASATGCQPNQLENIKVAVRLRPFTEKERQRNNKLIVDIEQNTVVLYTPKHKDVQLKRFTFDYSYWSHDGFKRDPSTGVNVPDPSQANHDKYVGQARVFEDLGQFLLHNALEGYNSALLAYGQTGSGKSYTVSGYGQNEGILPRFARALFEELDKKMVIHNETSGGAKGEASPASGQLQPEEGSEWALPGEQSNSPGELAKSSSTLVAEEQRRGAKSVGGPQNRYEVYFSMIEIYNEVVKDLLAKNRGDSSLARKGLKVREHPRQGFFVENLSSFLCADREEIEQRIEEGQLNKSIAATSMNETSSRGHTIYEFKIKQFKQGCAGGSGAESVTISVVQLVDLAGSERMAVHANQLNLPANQPGPPQSRRGGSMRSKSPSPRAGTGNSQLLEGSAGRLKQLKSAGKINTNSASSSSSASANTSVTAALMRNSKNSMLQLNANLQQRFKESVSINQSLSALGNCIQVLSQYSQQLESGGSAANKSNARAPKIPYRDSVLTKLLNRCCLSGNSRVVIIATLSPADVNYDDTLSTLRFADRAKQIRTHAIINRMSRGDMALVNSLQRENNRLKQIVDGRVTRSDDSSQTSNFDENENVMENFTGSKISKSGKGSQSRVEAITTPVRGRTTIKKSGTTARSKHKPSPKPSSASSNPAINESKESAQATTNKQRQLNRLISPASEIKKSRSVGQNLAKSDYADELDDIDQDIELVRLHKNAVDIDDDIADDEENIKDGIISPDSDSDSFAALADEELSQEEKISIFNRLLSNSTVNNNKSGQLQQQQQPASQRPKKTPRPKRASRIKAGIREVALLSSSLKKTNPYLSNLNPDEQLSGMISYIIKTGETVVGKANEADIMLHGPELKSRHARITRDLTGVFIEPISEQQEPLPAAPSGVALMVNGSPVNERTRLNHCDRLLFGTNAFFVFADTTTQNGLDSSAGDTVANLDLVTFDMAKSEVLRKVMSEAKNEAMIKEINDYTHRPGTGKRPGTGGAQEGRRSSLNNKQARKFNNRSSQDPSQPAAGGGLAEEPLVVKEKSGGEFSERSSGPKEDQEEGEGEEEAAAQDQSSNYRDQLMEDTYEYAMPVAEVNAVAKEMAIRVTYGLKILTGEEQLPQDQSSYLNSAFLDSNDSDESASSSTVDNEKARQPADTDRLTNLRRLDGLDIPPALYVKVHLEELDMDFYWSKEKFQARREKILELYGAWDVSGKSGLVEYLIEQSKAATISSATSSSSNAQSEDNNYLFDPFIDDPQTSFVLVGNAQISLQPLSHLADIKHTYELLDVEDETVGEVNIELIPCHEEPHAEPDSNSPTFEPFSEEDLKVSFLEEPEKLLGRKLVFMLKIVSCRKISKKFVNVFCQYSLKRDESPIKTKVVRTFSFAGISYDSQQQSEGAGNNQDEQEEEEEGAEQAEREERAVEPEEELVFDNWHYIYIDQLDEELLNFLRHGFLTVQVVGQYKEANSFTSTIKSPTVVSTIINSINKYKHKILQAGSAGSYNIFSPDARGNSSVYNFNANDLSKANMIQSSSTALNSNSGASSVVSTVNMFDQQNDDEEGASSINGLSQENVIDMILTKRKLDRAENQLHFLKRTINIAEHYNKKHIPVKTVKKLLNLYGKELDSGSIEEIAANVNAKGKTDHKHSNCVIQ